MSILGIFERREILLATVLSLILLASGCNSNVQFGGRVSFSDDDSPLTTGTVVLEKDGYMARGALDENGRYQLGAEALGNGLEKGSYRVYVSGATETQRLEPTRDADGNIGNGYEIPKNLPPGAKVLGDRLLTPIIAPEFCDAQTSPLSVEIDSRQKTFDFKVDRINTNK
ncbi:MAG: hypothetical protein Q4G03_11340 [Planctomycetia bacterium]|nr:hypothetical protein [Planctomycetia bacterium]